MLILRTSFSALGWQLWLCSLRSGNSLGLGVTGREGRVLEGRADLQQVLGSRF